MNDKAKFPGIDERGRHSIQRIASIMYFINIQLIVFDVLFRQIFLKQDYREFEDLAVLIVFNALVFLIAVLWKGGITIPKFSALAIGSVYVLILIIGSLLGVLIGRFSGWAGYWPYLGRVAGVSAILMFIYIFAAWLGNRRLNKLSEEE